MENETLYNELGQEKKEETIQSTSMMTASDMGKRGGSQTLKRHGKGHFKRAGQLSGMARKKLRLDRIGGFKLDNETILPSIIPKESPDETLDKHQRNSEFKVL